MASESSLIGIFVLGSVNSGRATLAGRLCYELGFMSKYTIDKHEKETIESGKGNLVPWAWVLEKLKSQRELGEGVDELLCTFATPRRRMTIVDTPGHCHFVENVVTGRSEADHAVLVIDASDEVSEEALDGSQAGGQVACAAALGVGHLVVVLNKMDSEAVGFSEGRFEEVKALVGAWLSRAGFPGDKVTIVPGSAKGGDNLFLPSANMPWWRGSTVLQALDALEPRSTPLHAPLRIPVCDVFKIAGIGFTPTGRIASGHIVPGTMAIISPTNTICEVRALETFHMSTDMEAGPGDNVALHLKGVTKGQVKRGHVIGRVADRNPPRAAVSFTAMVVVVQQRSGQLPIGQDLVLICHTAFGKCTLSEVIDVIDRRTGARTHFVGDPSALKVGTAAIVKVVPKTSLCVEAFAEFPELGRIVVREGGSPLKAIGVITVVDKEPPMENYSRTAKGSSGVTIVYP